MTRWHNDNVSNERIRKTIVNRFSDQVADLPFTTADRRVQSSTCPCEHPIDFYMVKTADSTLERWSVAPDGSTSLAWDALSYPDLGSATVIRVVAGVQGGDEHLYACQRSIPGSSVDADKAIRAINGEDGTETWSLTLGDIKAEFSWPNYTNVTLGLLAGRKGGGCYILARTGGTVQHAIIDSAGAIAKKTAAIANHPIVENGFRWWAHPGGYLVHTTTHIRFIEEGGAALSERSAIAAATNSYATADVNGGIYIATPGVGGSVRKYDVDLIEDTSGDWPLTSAGFSTGTPPDLIALPNDFGDWLIPETIADGMGGNRPFIGLRHNNGSGATIYLNLHSIYGTQLWTGITGFGRDLGTESPFENFGNDIIHRNSGTYTRFTDSGVPCSVVTPSISGRTVLRACGHPCQID